MLVAPTTEEGMKESIRTTLTFLTEHMKDFTPMYTDAAYLKRIREYVAKWRWYLSHGYFKEPDNHLVKPPISWLYNLLVSHRSVNSLVSLLATPGLTPSTDAKNAADILMLKMNRITTYVEPLDIPSTFYLPPSDPKKTDQEGVPWAKSKSDAAKNFRKAHRTRQKELDSLKPEKKKPYEKTKEELKEYRKAKKDRRKHEKDTRAAIDKELVRMAKTEKRRQKEHGNKT